MKKISEYIIRMRVAIIVFVLLITLSLGYFIPQLKVNPDVMSYLPEDDEAAVLFENVGKRFGGNQTVIVGFKTDDIFTEKSLTIIRDITDSLKNTEGVRSVVSLTNIIDIREVDSVLTVSKLIDEFEIPTDKKVLDSIRDYAMSKDLYKGFIVSADSKMCMIAAKIEQEIVEKIDTNLTGKDLIKYYKTKYPSEIYEFEPNGDTMRIVLIKAAVANSIRSELKAAFPDAELYFGGLSFMTQDIGEIIMHDIVFLGPIAFIVILLALYLGFRNLRGVILPVLTVLVAIIWTLGLMAIFEFEITLVSNVIPIILLAVGSAYTIHVVNRIGMEESQKGDYKQNIVRALTYIVIPVFLAAVTTMIGFLSFIYGSYLTMIRDFGIFTALGVVFSLILSLSFAPAIISYFPLKNPVASESDDPKGMITKILNYFYGISIRKGWFIIIAWVVFALFMLVGGFQVERRVDLLDYFKKDHPSRQSETILRNSFGGTIPVYVQVEGNVQSPEVLKTMKTIENFLKQQPIVKHVQSVAVLIEEMNNIMGEGKRIPDEEEKITNLWFLLDGQEVMDQLVTSDLQSGLVQGIVTTSDSRDMAILVDSLSSFISRLPVSENVRVSQTGFPSIYKKLDDSILLSQQQSMVIAILMVFVFVAILLKSAWKGFLSTIPILFTLAVLFGFLGWFGIPLDVATVLVASVSIGIGIDYAIHMISLYSHEQKTTTDIGLAVKNSFKGSGKPIIINVFSVTVGFLVLLFSDLVPLQRFGISIAITMITSGLATLTLLPAIIFKADNFKNRIKSKK